MKKVLLLYGFCGKSDIWNKSESAFRGMEIVKAAYPREITAAAKNVSDITKWVYEKYGCDFDFIIGHSMGGLIALQLAANFTFNCRAVIFIESNLRPANAFYRNLLMPDNMVKFGKELIKSMKKESEFYTVELKSALQENFDYSQLIDNIKCEIYGIYGDRGIENYAARIDDLRLDKKTTDKIKFKFVKNSCHMPMLENSEDFVKIIKECLQ